MNYPFSPAYSRGDARHEGVRAIQNMLNVRVTGVFDSSTDAAVRSFQFRNHINVSGLVGPVTGPALFKPVVLKTEQDFAIPNNYLVGLVALESGFDPAIVGDNGTDTGIAQINLASHKDISAAQAMDPGFALPWAARELLTQYDHFSKGNHPQMAWTCAIAYHNSPLWASQWSMRGVPPNDTIKRYVELVLERAKP